MTAERKECEEMFDERLREGNPQIIPLSTKAEKSKVETKIEYYKAIQALRKASRIQPE